MNLKKGKYIVFDTETTGLDSKACSTISISGIIIIDGKILETFDLYHRPFKGAVVAEEALERNGFTKEEIYAFPSPEKTYTELFNIWGKYVNRFDREDKAIPIGYNIPFDIDFISAMDGRTNVDRKGIKKKFSRVGSFLRRGKRIDTLNLVNVVGACTDAFDSDTPIENHKLETVCEWFGIEIDPHKSMSDATATWELTLKLLDRLSWK